MERVTNPALVHRQPGIVAVGLHRLRSLLRELAPSYGDRAAVTVLDLGFEEAVQAIEALRRTQPVDVLVAAGSNGAFLRQHLDMPVVLVRVGEFDVMRALGRARAISSRIALVTYGEISAEVQRFSELFHLGIEQRSYRTEQEASDGVRELRAKGIEVVVAPGLVADLADQLGMTGVFLYSQDAVREALDDAVEIARVARIELSKRERLNTILGQLRDGVVAVDMQERIELLNPSMARLLDAEAEPLLGRPLSEVAPELSLRDTLREARPALDEAQRFGTRMVVVSRLPIVEQGVQTGAVLTCTDPVAIERMDRSLRTRQPRRAATRYQLDQIVGSSPALLKTKALAARCAAGHATVLIIGESGTGKEMLAQGIHNAGPRRRQPFIAVNCAAFPEALLESELFGYEEGAFTGSRRGGKAGLFESAHTGTIFLDEIGEMPLALQTRLLRVLQEREVQRIGATEPTPIDVRVIAATHRNLADAVEAGEFRRDLYYRLNILRLEVPALRERLEDLPLLVGHMVERLASRPGGLPPAMTRMVDEVLARGHRHAWPGNVRELDNLIERLAVYSAQAEEPAMAQLRLRDLAPELYGDEELSPSAGSQPVTAQDAELQHIAAVLRSCQGDRALACARLGISRTTLWRKLKQLRP
ncbi:propionate catabolism operon regulatory protein PrpR [Aquabacterium sp. A7-Y]|uniref:propionate catabolism operon regulatory protein PrpR n=1 Tax=Aquabacterium sp. A7-Y TaxID=1349605 RepID=UPI00223E4EE7|nr:propionate catabolism operon regulatory protein PrpR [Aquabacterium sp. A7-Y]MCW7539477.1 propionate catabolism operon regulatory protein PrpR [Aquabacterium sp. A7-Y]